MADSYYLCSIYEGKPISLIEALGVGVVPIYTPVGGIVDVIMAGENGFLARGFSVKDCCELLKRFHMSKLKQMAKDRYITYSMKMYVELFI